MTVKNRFTDSAFRKVSTNEAKIIKKRVLKEQREAAKRSEADS